MKPILIVIAIVLSCLVLSNFTGCTSTTPAKNVYNLDVGYSITADSLSTFAKTLKPAERDGIAAADSAAYASVKKVDEAQKNGAPSDTLKLLKDTALQSLAAYKNYVVQAQLKGAGQ